MYAFKYTFLKDIPELEIIRGKVVQVVQLSKCASHSHVLSKLGVGNNEGLLEEFFSEPFEINEERALGDFLIQRLS